MTFLNYIRIYPILLLVCFGCFSVPAIACDCPPPEKIDLIKVRQPRNLVFLGTVIKTDSCKHGVNLVYFKVKKLFNGKSDSTVAVQYDCSSDCMMSFTAGDEWLIYAEYFEYGKTEVKFCSRSRKRFSTPAEDVYWVTSQMTFDDELNFLEEKIGLQTISKPKDDELKRDIGVVEDPMKALFLLISSLTGMILIYWFVKRVLK